MAGSSQPLSVPESVTSWFTDTFAIKDDRSSTGEQFANQFTADGRFHTLIGVATGTEELRVTRKDAWANCNDRKHTVLAVYTRNQDFTDVLCLGRIFMQFKNGQKVEEEFVAHVLFRPDGEGGVKAVSWKPYADSAPFIKAMTAA